MDRLDGLLGSRSGSKNEQDTHATGRCDSRNRSHASQGRINSSDQDRRENPEPLSGGNDTQAGHSRDATSMATAFEPLNRSLETFLTRLSRTNECFEKSSRVFKKPRNYNDESDGCIDTWIEVMKLILKKRLCEKDKNAVLLPATWKGQP